MFQKGDELVPLVSREILNLRTSDRLIEMEKRWFENQLPYTADDTLNPITLFRFRGLFMITGVSFAFALLVLLILWLRDTWEDLMSSVNIFLSQRLVNFRILFARTIHPNPLADAAIGGAGGGDFAAAVVAADADLLGACVRDDEKGEQSKSGDLQKLRHFYPRGLDGPCSGMGESCAAPEEQSLSRPFM